MAVRIMSYNIYRLIDPVKNEVRYIGFSKYQPWERLKWHLKEARSGHKCHKCNWIRELITQGLKPISELIEITEQWEEREIFWIQEYRKKSNLVNATIGGDGRKGYVCSAETRKKLSDALKGKPGRKHTKETKNKLSLSKLGKPLSEEHRNSLRKSPEARLKMSLAKRGRKVSDETKKKLSEIFCNRPITEQHLKQLEEARKKRMEKLHAQSN